MSLTPEQPKLDRMGVIVDGRRFEEWSEGRVSADIFTPANTFSLMCGPMGLEILRSVLPGRSISIYIGDGNDDTILLTGWTEGFVDTTNKRAWNTNITGRDLGSDLLENAVPEDLDVRGKTFYEIATEVCDVVGIPVICTNEANRLSVTQKKKYKKELAKYGLDVAKYNTKFIQAMKQKTLSGGVYYNTPEKLKAHLKNFGFTTPMQPPFVEGIFNTNDEAQPQDGESCWDFLSRYCKALEVFMWMSAGGVLVIQRPRYDQDPQYVLINRISRPEQNNFERTVSIDIASIPTSYKRIGRYKGKGDKRERLSVEYESTRVIPSSDTPTMPTGQGEQNTDLVRVDSAFCRAVWEMDTEAHNLNELGNRAWYALKAMEMGFMTIDATLDGWDQGGIPYAPDTVCRVIDEKLDLDGSYYIASCEYLLNDRASGGGRKTRVTLTPLYMWSPA